jgi:hypothetical protein
LLAPPVATEQDVTKNTFRIRNVLTSVQSALFDRNSDFRLHRAAGKALLIRIAGAAIGFLSRVRLRDIVDVIKATREGHAAVDRERHVACGDNQMPMAVAMIRL